MFLSLFQSALRSIFFFALHVDTTNIFPKPLSRNEEAETFKILRNGTEQEKKLARNKLIEHNLRLVAHIIKKYYSGKAEQDELISVGTFGLVKAVTTFNDEKNSRFATYASKCIENEVLMYFRSQKKTAGNIYFDEPIDTDKNGNPLTLMDIISDDESILERIDLTICSQQLYSFIGDCLDERELEIITKRYGLFGEDSLTQKEVAEKLGISRSYVSRIEKKAISKLKKIYL